jgi:hypothetical protein
MSVKDLNRKKTPIVTIDNSLEKLKDQPLFQEKVDKANEVIRKVGLPRKKKKASKQTPKNRVSS